MLLANGLVRLPPRADYEAHPQQAAAREYIVHAGKEMCGYFNELREWPWRAEHRVWSEFTASKRTGTREAGSAKGFLQLRARDATHRVKTARRSVPVRAPGLTLRDIDQSQSLLAT
jgi:hypothetical protein